MAKNTKQRRSASPSGSSGPVIPEQWQSGTLPRSAGSSTPARRMQSRKTGNANTIIADGIQQYRMTAIYQRGLKSYKNAAALENFNNWVKTHIKNIDPALAQVCHICGNADLILCEHNITVEKEEIRNCDLPVSPVLKVDHFVSYNYWNAIKQLFAKPGFNFSKQNNRTLGGFSNEHVTDNNIIPELYNYVKLRMQSSYAVNGFESRPLRLEHCRRLASKWLEQRKLEKRAEEDTVLTNRIMFTTQRVCDNAENAVLYGETNPNQSFSIARLSIFAVLLILLMIYLSPVVSVPFTSSWHNGHQHTVSTPQSYALVVKSTSALDKLLRNIIPSIVQGVVDKFVNHLVMTTPLLQLGSQHVSPVLITTISILINVIVYCTVVTMTCLCWRSRRR